MTAKEFQEVSYKSDKVIQPDQSVPFKPTKAHKELKWKEAIDLLNDIVKIKLTPVSAQQIGVVALRDIKKGEKLYTDIIPNAFDLPFKKFKKLKPEIRDIIIGYWPQVVNGSHFLYPVTKMNAFLNHSDDFNYDALNDVTLKDIKQGEEITVNYKSITNWKKIFKWLK